MKFSSRFALLGLALGMGVNGASFAASFQDAPPASDDASSAPMAHAPLDPQKLVARLSRKLQLTPDQAAKIEPILKDRQQQIQQLHGDTSLSSHDLHQKTRALKQDTENRVMAILSDSQRKQYLLMLQKAVQKWHDKKHGAPAADATDDDDGGNP